MHTYANPTRFQRTQRALVPLCAAVAVLCGAMGVWMALMTSPADYQQGEAVRIMYVHVPAAWMASLAYAVMAACSASFLIWRHPLADVLARESAPIGMVFTLITLLTGMLWGKPTWGAYWVWDARLTSMLVLLLLYIGYLAMAHGGGNDERGRVACAWLALIGAMNLPIIKFSVEWWNTLHQPASLLRAGGPRVDGAMLTPLLLMIAAFMALFVLLLFVRAETALRQKKLQRLQIQRVARKNASIG